MISGHSFIQLNVQFFVFYTDNYLIISRLLLSIFYMHLSQFRDRISYLVIET